MQLTIHGPNLNDQTKGTFHVHTADCSDNKREETHNNSVEPWTIDAASVDDVVDAVYDDQFAEDPSRREPDSYEHYVADFHFAPCTSKLPRRDVVAKPKRKRVSKSQRDAAIAKVADELQNVDVDAAVAAATKPAAKRGEKLQLPTGTTPARLVLAFVTECATSDADAGGQARPFITHTNKLVIHAQWFRAWLQTNRERVLESSDVDVTVSQAVTILRDDLKFADRSVAVIGAPTKNLSVWMIDAPKTMKSIERQAAPERKSAAKSDATPAPEPAKPARKRASSKSTTSKSTTTRKSTSKSSK